jgi:hypothetical protein
MSSPNDTENAEAATTKEPKKAPHGKPRTKLPGAGGDGKSRWVTYAALAIAVIAVAVAIAAWLRPAHSSAPHFSDQQTADAKKSMCTAYTSVHRAVVDTTHMANPKGDDPVGQLAVQANARLALLGGGQYLRERLAANPATPADLAKAVTAMADTTEDLGVAYLSGATPFAVDPQRQDLLDEVKQLNQLCGG